ncbi:MAG: glycosyltransferase family 4 protein [Arenicellales bacterium]
MPGRALIITSIYPPLVGGPATFSHRFANALVERGVRVTVVCAVPGPAGDGLGYRLVRAGVQGNSVRRELDTRTRLLAEALRNDWIFCAGLEEQAAWASNVLRRRFVLRIGGDVVWEMARNAGMTALEPGEFYDRIDVYKDPKLRVPALKRARQFERASKVVFVSDYLRRLAGHWGIDERADRIVVPNGVETGERFGPARRSGDTLEILFVGRYVNWKGIDAAILAVRGIESVNLTIAGAGPLEPLLKDLVCRLRMADRVSFEGSVEPGRMVGFMHRHHVLVLPSLYEGMSNTLLEAGLAGIACIASNRGGNPEVIEHDVNGVLVDPFDVAELERWIVRLREDENLRLRLAEAHQERVVNHFGIDTATQGCLTAAGWDLGGA